MEMVHEASDETLIDLAEHVGFSFERAAVPAIDPPFWQKGMFRLFVSHLAKYRAFAAELQTALLDFGISCFVAHNDIEPTEDWQTQIQLALATCDSLIALLHPGFHISNWTDQEIGFAMGRGVPTFAVQFGQTPYGFIGRFQAFNGATKPATLLARELFDAYRKNKQTQRRMSDVMVGLFEKSDSFAQARVRVGYLEQLDSWDQAFSTRIRAAVNDNSQVSGSWGVPQRVELLIQKWAKSAV